MASGEQILVAWNAAIGGEGDRYGEEETRNGSRRDGSRKEEIHGGSNFVGARSGKAEKSIGKKEGRVSFKKASGG